MQTKPLTPKTVQKTPHRGPRTTGVLPRYVMVKQEQRVARTVEVWEGRVFVDLNADGELIGVEVI